MSTALPPSAALRAAKRAFLARFDAFCAATGRKPGGVSNALFGSVRKVKAMRDEADPRDVNVETLAAADEKLSAMAAEAGIKLPLSVDNGESESGEPRPLHNGASA